MTLDRDSRLIRWAYLFERREGTWGDPTWSVSLCLLFWRIVLISPLKILLPLSIIGLCALGTWEHPWLAVIIVGITAGILGLVALISYYGWYVKLAAKAFGEKVDDVLGPSASRMAAAVGRGHRKVCPLFEVR